MDHSKYKKYFDLSEITKGIKKYLPSFDKKKFMKAFEFANHAHDGQMRKDEDTPYIVHPVKIVEILMGMRADEDMLIAALLHDVPEDTKYDIYSVKAEFGERVAFLVDGITKLSKVHYRNNMPERQIESLKKLFLHSAKDPCVILIKLADRLHNMRTLQFIPEPEKRLRIASETLEIYVPMANLLGIQEIKFALENLCFTHIFPTEHTQLKKKIESLEKKCGKTLKKLLKQIKDLLKENNIKSDVQIRKRNLYSIYKKLCSEGKNIDQAEDRIAIRIIVKDIYECYQTLGVIHSKFTPIVKRFKDYIANPKPNGYQSLHTEVFGPEELRAEIQIKTKEMHREAEYGIASNFFKKNGGIHQDKRYSWLDKVLDIDRSQKDSNDFMENLKLDVLKDRIIIFTPRGDGIDLPEGGTAIDFAYAINSELGDHAGKAEVNGRIVPMTTILRNRDHVNILESKEYSPKLSWLFFAKTNYAKERIKSYLKNSGKDSKIKEGKQILQKEFDIAEMGHLQNTNFKKMSSVIRKELGQNFKDLEDLFVAIGEGQIKAVDIVQVLKKEKFTKKKKRVKANVRIVAKNREGLLRDIYDVFYRYSSDMLYMKGAASNSQENAYFTAKIIVADIADVGHIFTELEQIDTVTHVHRISNKGMYSTIALTVLTIVLWLTHPLIIKSLANVVQVQNELLFNFIVDVGIFGLFFMVMYLSFLMKTYFPLIRQKKAFWVFTFSLPSLALLALFIEIYFFDLQLSWRATIIEVAIIYVYLGISFRSFKKLS